MPHNVYDYLITCAEQANGLDPTGSFPNAKEKLLIRQDSDALNLSLYLDNSVVSNLLKNDPAFELHEDNFEDFCLALEGISHFIYMMWNAIHDRSVTLLELELQAEVDKFVMLANCITQQENTLTNSTLRKLLFESVKFDKALDRDERQRYRDANYFAEKYCWRLEANYLSNGSERALLNELRRFYRLDQKQKIQRINQLN